MALKDGRVIAQIPPRDTVDAALVKDLYGLDADIPHAPGGRRRTVPARARIGGMTDVRGAGERP
ncbi:hypothetical protein [Streptomyces tricolor]|uniref:hypothetical protein n=1 Tax=Streptomyces tricolor TaxID=68277 RepID=UPI0036ED446B